MTAKHVIETLGEIRQSILDGRDIDVMVFDVLIDLVRKQQLESAIKAEFALRALRSIRGEKSFSVMSAELWLEELVAENNQ